jgi:Kef-type K+ transport system membrane component KefB
VFGGLFVLVFASAYVADRIGINVIVGAFIAGAVLPARDLVRRDISARTRDITIGVLLPVFLAFSGLATDFTKLGISFVVGIALFLAAGIAGKWIGGAVSARVSGLTWQEGNVLGVLMNCRGLLVLVVALAALNAGVITPQLQVAAVLMALVTTMMTGPLFDTFMRQLPPEESEPQTIDSVTPVAV